MDAKKLHRCAAALACVLATGLSAGAARAQTSAVAEALFQKGHELLKAGKVHEACDKFAESQKVEPALGTYLSLAACHEKEGRNATAWTEFQEARAQAQRAHDAARESYARQHADSIEKLLHRVVIEVMARPAGIAVQLDHQPLGSAAWGTPIPLDPGEHVIDVTAPGRRSWQRKILAGPGAGTDRIEVPSLEDATATETPPPMHSVPPAETPPVATTPTPSATVAPPPVIAPPASRDAVDKPSDGGTNGKRIAGFVVGGAGIVGVGVAIYAGVHAGSLASDRDALCPPGTPCRSQDAFNLDHDAQIYRLVAIVSGIAGGAAIAAGTVLILTSKDDKARTTGTVRLVPDIGKGHAGLSLGGTF